MAGMYPDNQQITLFGESVEWPGMNSEGKFTNGSFDDPLEKPSFIPSETLNLILDNLSSVVAGAGHVPNSTSGSQVLEAIEKMLKEKTDDYWIKFFQNKIYVQRWGDLNPADIWDFEGYRWSEINRQGVFDRPRGAGAPFKAMINGVETYLVGGGDVEFDGVVHGDSIREIEGEAMNIQCERGYNVLAKKALSAENYSGLSDAGSGRDRAFHLSFNASRVVPTGNENTPIYQTAIYWKLEEI